ncbi:thioether cross-link-forming SCIFF peptide maturase [Peptostreptococcus russellii]|uniref:thioether cross-link-forming SCIFF peptide maturase n=1 Tax=Peptostreptococcus russellii TaxID=215200 RepID=UPI0026F0CFF7|nr:thioether cross-link-forming SCIFF peptide maturase [Peptostreptococcus russellii]
MKMIHKYNMNGYNIVIDVNGGAVHVVDDVTYRVLDFYEDKNLEEIVELLSNEFDRKKVEESYKEIEELVKEGLLYTEDEYEFHPSFVNREPVIKALCLNVAHDCNLKCKYCFAKQGDFGGNAELMPLEIGKKAMDFLVANSGNRKNLDVDFFGGEPLMNWEVVKELVKYGREIEKPAGKNMRFTITTNGVLLDDEKIDFINEHMHNVVLSLDGRKEINDNMRLTVNDKGSYDVIVPKFQKLVSQRPKDKYYYVRGTFTRNNLDFSKDINHFADLGFELTSVEPVVDDESNPFALREEDLPKIFEEYENYAAELAERQLKGEKLKFFHFMIDLNQGPCVIKRITGCGAGNEYISITPNGDIYPCHQFVGKEEFIMANLNDDKIEIPEDMREMFRNAHVYNKEECKTCWNKFYCSGGCHANAINFNGDIRKPYELGCEMQRKRTECAIMIQAKLLSEGK